ncbi:MAG: 16S rRNA (guanine(966)-N(2))-methyltransferase RsmD [Limosilactobacillus sp.]|uniref:16S rRNA (guanine(966)-N(2))-methyltransferase RsmD n=1 Tax=Limosilactobacillus sp. TaxID=2773925 RepID=UPI002706958D|nr:16S rRNA (guanine(966)-N(2))-methyltransferase RsmD [Limosilactobacillus sp.]
MRIVSGKFGGRRLSAVPGMETRPTTDKVKESLFNIIGPYFDGGTSLDLFGGSGGLSIEAVSRGIDKAVLIDRQYAAIKTINKNIAVTKHPELFDIFKMDATKALSVLAKKGYTFNLIFLDPPYAKQQIVKDLTIMHENGLLEDDALVVAETDEAANLPTEDWGQFTFIKQQNYGITYLTLYRYKKER